MTKIMLSNKELNARLIGGYQDLCKTDEKKSNRNGKRQLQRTRMCILL